MITALLLFLIAKISRSGTIQHVIMLFASMALMIMGIMLFAIPYTTSVVTYPAYNVITTGVPLFCVNTLNATGSCATGTEVAHYPAYNVITIENPNLSDTNSMLIWAFGIIWVVICSIMALITFLTHTFGQDSGRFDEE